MRVHLLSRFAAWEAASLPGWFSVYIGKFVPRPTRRANEMHNMHNLHTEEFSQVIICERLVAENGAFEKMIHMHKQRPSPANVTHRMRRDKPAHLEAPLCDKPPA